MLRDEGRRFRFTNLKISIAIVNFNREKYLRRAIRSAQNQIRLGFDIEILFIDDNSTDNSRSLIDEFNKSTKTRFLHENKGVGNASQVALEMAQGDYFLRLDSDDFLSPISCLTLFTALEARVDYQFAYGDHYRVDDRETRTSLVELDSFEKVTKHGAGIMFRTEILRDVGGYDSSLRFGEDADLIYRLVKKGYRGLYVPLPLYRYHIHGENLSLNPKQEKSQNELRNKYEI